MMIRKGGIIAILCCIGEWIKEKTEPTPPANVRFDWDAYWADIRNGIGAVEQLEKRKRGGYYTTTPLPEPKEIIEGVVDIDRYNRDLKRYGKEAVEICRKKGLYKHIIKSNQ